ncbi:MAG: ATP-binding protein [Bacteroidota bacterium]
MTNPNNHSIQDRKEYYANVAIYFLIGLSLLFAGTDLLAQNYKVAAYNATFGFLMLLIRWLGRRHFDTMLFWAVLVTHAFYFGHAYWVIPGEQLEDALAAMLVVLPVFLMGFWLWFFVFANVVLFYVALLNAGYEQVFYTKYMFYFVNFLVVRAFVQVNHRYEGELVIQRDKIARDATRLQELDELKTRFFANVSHELRTPLTLVLSPLESILRSNELSNRNHTYLQLAQQNARKLLRRVNELLELSRLDENRLQVHATSTNIYQFTKHMVSLYEGAAQIKGVALHYENELPESRLLLLDQEKVEVILSNLLNNALKFTPREGSIRVSISKVNAQLQISVQDTGVGIPATDIEQIFQRFQQASNAPKTGGSGIGLSLSRELTELMEGSLQVESELGQGSTFYLQLPFRETITAAAEASPKQQAPLQLEASADDFHPERPSILVVEDNYDLRMYLQQLLTAEQYQVQVAEHGRAALEQLQRMSARQEIPAIIISDIMMPEMDGMELLQALKDDDEYRSIPFLMLTAQQNTPVKIEALRIGVDDYLTKPFIAAELLARIKNLITNAENRASSPEQKPKNPAYTAVSQADLNWLKTVEEGVMAHISEPNFKLSDLAAELFLAPRTLQQKIKAITGLTPKQYERKIKLHEARRIIQAGEVQTVSELSAQLGFENQHYLSSLYQKEFGLTPRAAING